jgi:type IX secretion system PorP/SprF family membrane protein
MKKVLIIIGFCIPLLSVGQDMHFSQFYNAPLLLNPANTGMHTNGGDMRVGINYRSQWLTVPVPYNTTSAFADFGINKEKEGNWLGVGVAFWQDKAGNGDLALSKAQLNLAYHFLLDDNSTFSMGMSGAYSQRSVDLNKLTFERQWDEFSFNTSIDNGENARRAKTSFADLGVGASYTYFNQNDFSLTISAAAMHINRPIESFYGESNKLGLRPQIHIQGIYKASPAVILTPSVYYTMQKKASQLVLGSLYSLNVNGGSVGGATNELVLGTHYRLNDAVIGSMGYRYKHYQLMVSYDHTVSDFQRANQSIGAFEISLIMERPYQGATTYQAFACPRF